MTCDFGAHHKSQKIGLENSEFTIPVDTVIMALGTSPNPLIRTTTSGLDVNKKGCLVVDVTNLKNGVYFVKVVTENGEIVKWVWKL